MKTITILLFAFLATTAIVSNAQKKERSVYRKGYVRLGIDMLGSSLDKQLSPKANVLAGNYGAGTGFIAEFGHSFYFGKRTSKINFGLDWNRIVPQLYTA